MNRTKPKDVLKKLEKLRNKSLPKKPCSTNTIPKYGLRIEPLPKR